MFCATIIVATLTITTVIRAQPAALDDAGNCLDQFACAGIIQLGSVNYGECCGDPARISFLRDNPLSCFDCPSGVLVSIAYS